MAIYYVKVEMSTQEADALLAALDGFEPDTASYNPDDPDSMGWSPEDVAALDSVYEKIAKAETY